MRSTEGPDPFTETSGGRARRSGTQPGLESLPPQDTLSKQVARHIKKAIQSGHFKLGMVYSSNMLTTQLGVSRTPLREAVMDLEAQGLVTILPKRGFMLREFSAQDILEIYELRLALESQAIRKLAKDPSGYDFSTLHAALTAQEKALEARESEQHIAQGQAFHKGLVTLSGNARMLDIYQSLDDLIRTAWIYAFTHRTVSEREVISDHWTLYSLVTNGEAEAALTLLEQHLERSLGFAMQPLKG